MTAYLVGTVLIIDPSRFVEYVTATKGLAAAFGGEPVVVGGVAEIIEGDSPAAEKIIVTRFPSAEQAKAYIGSPRYKAAKKLREGAAVVNVRLIVMA